jgi:hypothetical protein
MFLLLKTRHWKKYDICQSPLQQTSINCSQVGQLLVYSHTFNFSRQNLNLFLTSQQHQLKLITRYGTAVMETSTKNAIMSDSAYQHNDHLL